MKIIFLDIDGVLNCRFSKSRIGFYIGIDNDKVKRLREIVDATGAKIVLCSSWKDGWHFRNKEVQDEHANYLDRKLRREGLYIFDKTTDKHHNRGEGIRNWIAKRNDVSAWIVLDDEVFTDYEECGVIPHLIKTSFYMENGGLQTEHVEQAIYLLSNIKKEI